MRNDPGIQVMELEPVERIEITGTYRIVSFDLMAVEEIELPNTTERSEDGDE